MVTRRAENTLDLVTGELGPQDRWNRLPGRDTGAAAYSVDGLVVKIRTIAEYEAAGLCRSLDAVHSALAPLHLAPHTRWHCYDGETLATVFDHVPHTGQAVAPTEIGAALACAHQALAGIEVRTAEPWVGFYGEHHEFAMTTRAVADKELRDLGLALLPHARRTKVPGPCHYVHRDLHPGNVFASKHGPCLVDWDLAHAGSAVDDLAMTAVMWAAESAGPPRRVAQDILAGYNAVSGRDYTLGSEVVRPAIALAGLRQGIAAWHTDQGDCSAAYWPFVRLRTRIAAFLVTAD